MIKIFLFSTLCVFPLIAKETSPLMRHEEIFSLREHFPPRKLREEEIPLLSLNLGVFNVMGEDRATSFQLEYTSRKKFLEARLLFGMMGTDQGSIFAYGGIGWDIYLGKTNFIVIPGFAPGLYYRGNGKDLGFPLEFRSSMSLAYELKNTGRVGVQLYHISNCRLGKTNPGEESVIFYYAIALN